MRIAVNASILSEQPTGLGIYTANVIRELTQILNASDSITVFTGYPDAFDGLGVRVVPLSKWVQPRYGKAAGLYRFAWTQLSFAAHMLAAKFDLAYHTTHHGLPYRIRKTPQVVTVQNDMAVNFQFREQHYLQYYYARHFMPRLLDASAAIITTSAYAKGVIAQTYGTAGAKVYYEHNGFNENLFLPTSAVDDGAILRKYKIDSAPFILVVGATYPHKNLARLLEAYEAIHQTHPHIRLCIAGYRKSYLQDVLLQASDEVKQCVVALPYVPQEDLPALYRAAICLAFPSLHESFGIPCVEAMATGCPVIVSRASSLPEVCGDAVRYVDPHEMRSMTTALHQVIESQSLRSELRTRGLERAQRFRWRSTAKTIYQVLQEVHRDTKGKKAEAGKEG